MEIFGLSELVFLFVFAVYVIFHVYICKKRGPLDDLKKDKED